MATKQISVDTFFCQLDHPLASAMQSLRAAILAADSAISERIKWNVCQARDVRSGGAPTSPRYALGPR